LIIGVLVQHDAAYWTILDLSLARFRKVSEAESRYLREGFEIAQSEITEDEFFNSPEALRTINYLQAPIPHLPKEEEGNRETHNNGFDESRLSPLPALAFRESYHAALRGTKTSDPLLNNRRRIASPNEQWS
jgi:hypothetical protein